MNAYLVIFPFHPDRFNPDSVEHRRLLCAAFKNARPANPVKLDASDKEVGPCIVGAGGRFYLEAQGAELFAVEPPEEGRRG